MPPAPDQMEAAPSTMQGAGTGRGGRARPEKKVGKTKRGLRLA